MLSSLENNAEFLPRHIGPTEQHLAHMLEVVGAESLPALIKKIVPQNILKTDALDLPNPLSEVETVKQLRAIAQKNKLARSFIGQGYYGTLTPAVIQRNILENPAWYTAYTPYQPEIAQGRLEALLNFQTLVADLTQLPIANASLLDEATAAAEAMTLAKRSGRNTSNVFFASQNCHPQTLAVLRTRAQGLNIELQIGDESLGLPLCFGALVQYPDTFGHIADYQQLAQAAHAQGSVVVCACDLLALTLITPPGTWGADIAIGSAQRFGVPLGFGGPHAAFMSCIDEFKRNMPGRIVGVSKDAQGETALRLALQTREQHIRREKATSNICTAQVLLAVMASMYAVYHGPSGLKRIAQRVQRLTALLALGLEDLGITVVHDAYFDTLLLKLNSDVVLALRELAEQREINIRYVDSQHVAISFDETVDGTDLINLLTLFAEVLGGASLSFSQAEIEALDLRLETQLRSHQKPYSAIPAALLRNTHFLEHAVFNQYQSETDMLRYLRRLADKDLALDRTMIPLGSCTMKLNATTEMLAVTWPEFSAIHPFAPAHQTQGYQELISQLARDLCEITGYDAISLQPNSGAQGEYAGLLAIRAYHDARGDQQRHICLIPASAHGTNPASAQMAGMDVVVVACDSQGNVDLNDLRAKLAHAGNHLAALMITYPSTHGVFEESVTEICQLVHAAGGQVYTDGANMNALVGVAQPGKFGSDVSHLNLHKTFCIPHGGGGPGVGPVAVKSHLAPYLPRAISGLSAQQDLSKTSLHDSRADSVGPVSAAPFGSASILPISWAYIRLMGASGLQRATQVAILNANYVAKRLAPYYPILYSGQDGLIAHECILDIRPLKEATGIGAEDIAKRLIDYGFHAPTMSFPVAGTLMVEPTESESLAELERFIRAMIAIRQEIHQVQDGVFDAVDNPLKNAPHTASMCMANEWHHTYTREQAAYPVPILKQTKYWPAVARVDNVHGDRHLICSCPPLEGATFDEQAEDTTNPSSLRAA